MGKDRGRTYETQARHRERNFDRMIEYLGRHPCSDCGESDPRVLDFDHLPMQAKRFEISRAVNASTRSWAAILREIAKCEVVCANCHRRRTAQRGRFRKHLIALGEWERLPPLPEVRRGRRPGEPDAR